MGSRQHADDRVAASVGMAPVVPGQHDLAPASEHDLRRVREVRPLHALVAAACRHQRRLVDEVRQVRPRLPPGVIARQPEVHVVRQRQCPRVHRGSRADPSGRAARRDAAIEAPGRSSGVRGSRAGCRGEHDDARRAVEAVHLREDLVESLPAPVAGCPAPRGRPIASSSSMKTIAGAVFGLLEQIAHAPGAHPTTSSTNSDAESEKNGTPASPATARASSVLPVPGGPESRTPRGMTAPSRW